MFSYDATAMTQPRSHRRQGGVIARCARALAVVAVAFLFTAPVEAADILLTSVEDGPQVQDFVAQLRQHREQDTVRYVITAQLPSPQLIPVGTRLILLDPASLEWRLSNSGGPPTLVLRINRLQAHQYLDEQRAANLTLIWRDPPPARQLRLIRQLLPKARQIGVLFGKESQFMLNDLRHAATALGMRVMSQPWDFTEDIRPLQTLLKRSDVLLGLNDPQLYNALTMKNLTLSAYADQQALIGPTASFIKAGSLASTYSDQTDWINTLSDLLEQAPQRWPRTLYPNHFKVMSNPQVASSLGLAPINEAALAASLAQGERRP
jgi:hypothetical protein